ncbi:MAG TPA: lipid A biosynthesis acyltransferase [Verrucomicrobiae bacterium]|nr:lipid A biosynthesis acyltransferase [Verrucomicrobiae bacterium]
MSSHQPPAPGSPRRKSRRWIKRVRRGFRFALIRGSAAAVGLLPLRLASALGSRAGLVAWSLASGERKKTLDSLAVAFPERGEQERRALGSACFAHLGRSLFELACCAKLDRSIDAVTDWPADSRAALDSALAKKKGVLFISGHVGHWELLARRVALAGYPCQTIAKETSDPRLTAFIESMRASSGLKAIWRGRPGAVKAMLGTLRRGEILGMLIDQDTKVQSVFVPFFGREAKTPRAAADLALRAGAAVVLGFCHRVGPTSFRITMREIATPVTGGETAVLELTHALTQGIEEAIRFAPEQWVWMHRRWRSRPEKPNPSEASPAAIARAMKSLGPIGQRA